MGIIAEPADNISTGFNLRTFGRDTIIYTIGQGLVLLCGLVQVLVIPKYLSVESYGYWQIFVLYTTYVGLLHFGFSDGILLRWAGRSKEQISIEVSTAFKYLAIQTLGTIIPFTIIFYFCFEASFRTVALLILAGAFVLNLFTFFKYALQAIRDFKFLIVIEVGRALIFIVSIVLLIVFNHINYHYVIYAFLTSFLIGVLILLISFRKSILGKVNTLSLWDFGKENTGVGIFILLGNFIIVLFLTLDRLLVSYFFTIEEFAIYAFAIMTAVVIFTLVKAISDVFFPNLSIMNPETQLKAYKVIKPAIIITWAALLILYFPIAEIIRHYIPAYIESLRVMQIILCMVVFGSLIQVVHVNYYKLYNMQHLYFLWGVGCLFASLLLNILAIKYIGTLESVAMATCLSFILWYLLNEFNMSRIFKKSDLEIWRYILMPISYLISYGLVIYYIDSFVFSFFIYASLFILITFVFFRHEIINILRMVALYTGRE